MYRTGPQLVQSLGAGVLAEQQHLLGRRLSYKRCGLHWLQLKPYTQSTVTHLGSALWGRQRVACDAQRNLGMSLRSSSTAFQAALLISCCLALQAERCDGFGAGEPSRGGVELKEPPVPVWKGFELEIVVVEAGVHMWFPSLATSQTFTEAGGITR